MAKKDRKKSGPRFEEDYDTTDFVVVDANGNVLNEGDSIIAIKDIKGKGVNIKRGDKFKNIKFTDDPELVLSGKIYLRTEFFKKG